MSMTLKQVRDLASKTSASNGWQAKERADAVATLDAHLSQPAQAMDCPACEGRPASGNSPCHVCGKSAQAVDVVAWRWRDDARPSLPWHTTNDAEVIQQMEATGGYEIEPLTRAIGNAQAEGWRDIATAPKDGRELILLLTPSRWPQVAYSNTWWTAGFSVECKPTHWLPMPVLPTPPTKDTPNAHE